ncbi:MAG: PEPxxWA-CTERM sorting domain-containing protein [Sphingomonadaceae bacterium]
MKLISRVAAAAAALAFAASPASAVTFAQVFQQNPGTPFVHTGGAGGATITAMTPMIFNVLDLGPLGIYGITAMTVNASSSAGIVDTGPQFEQVGWSGTITFLDGMTNVLTVNFTTGVLNVSKGAAGNQSGSLFASAFCGTALCYTSDVLNVDDLNINNFSLSFSSMSALYTVAGGDFAASVSGTFAGAIIPEPATWAMLIAGFGLVGFAARRRRVSALSA